MIRANGYSLCPHPTATVPEIPPLPLYQMQINAFPDHQKSWDKGGREGMKGSPSR